MTSKDDINLEQHENGYSHWPVLYAGTQPRVLAGYDSIGACPQSSKLTVAQVECASKQYGSFLQNALRLLFLQNM